MRDLYIALSGAMAQEQRLAIAANNLANVNTAGFKQDQVTFESLLPDIDSGLFTLADSAEAELPPPEDTPFGDKYYASLQGTYVDYSQGELRLTGSPLDLAIQGPGFFVVETPEGERYTRCGALSLNAQGQLATAEGHPLLGDGGPVQLQSGKFAVAEDGGIYVDGAQTARIRLVQFDDTRALNKVGHSLFATADPTVKPRAMTLADGTTIRQHALEYSNVNMVREMTRLIEIERQYQMAQKSIETIGDAYKQSIDGALR